MASALMHVSCQLVLVCNIAEHTWTKSVKMFSNILSSIKSELAFSDLLFKCAILAFDIPLHQHPAMLDHPVFTMTPLHYHTAALVASFKLLLLHVTSFCTTLAIGWS